MPPSVVAMLKTTELINIPKPFYNLQLVHCLLINWQANPKYLCWLPQYPANILAPFSTNLSVANTSASWLPSSSVCRILSARKLLSGIPELKYSSCVRTWIGLFQSSYHFCNLFFFFFLAQQDLGWTKRFVLRQRAVNASHFFHYFSIYCLVSSIQASWSALFKR